MMFKIVIACAFSQTYTVKVHLFWLQNFHMFLKFKCSFLKVIMIKTQKVIVTEKPKFLICNRLIFWSFNFSNTVKFFKAQNMKEYHS